VKELVECVNLFLGAKDEAANTAKKTHHNWQDGHQPESPKQMFKTRFESGSAIFFDLKLCLSLIHG
jgi:hypothetical protein